MFNEKELEALFYVSGDDGLTKIVIAEILDLSLPETEELLERFSQRLAADERSGLKIIKVNDLYKMVTKPEVSPLVLQYLKKGQNNSLSQAALEILAIVAYRQPITRIELDEIRGVNSSGPLQTLVNRGLIEVAGKKDVVGHPNLYQTTNYFLEYFGYETLADLPAIEEFESEMRPQNSELFQVDDFDELN